MLHLCRATLGLALTTALALAGPARAQTARPVAGALGRPARVVPRRHYVDAAANGANTGASWLDAFVDLQSALLLAGPADEVWVAAGTYRPSPWDATASFVVPSGLQLLGGFAGYETAAWQRDPVTHVTVLSGDIGQDDVIGAGWPLGWNIGSANSGHIVVASGCDSSTLVDGFTLAGGSTGPVGTSAGHPLMYGGGLFATNASLVVRRCTFTHNLAAFASGGGAYISDGSPVFEDCRFVQNYAHVAGGGGLAVVGSGAPVLRGCEFQGNVAVAGSISAGDGDGAGILSYAAGGLTLDRCRFEANTARPFYSVGDEIGYGGGVFAWTGVVARDCVFTGNVATFGAALIAWDDSVIVDSVFTNNEARPHPNDPYPEIGGMGALVLYSFAPAELAVESCTFVANRAKKHAAVFTVGAGAHATLENSIVWGNHATHSEVIGYTREHLGGSWDAAYSCIQVVFGPPAQGEDLPDPNDLPGCIELDPLLRAAPADVRLAAGSPCIDAGSNARAPLGNALDVAGLPRFVDDPLAPDVGQGVAPLIDMGAHERQ